MSLEADLSSLLNRYSRENNSNTPDFILASYILKCLDAYEVAVNHRDRWYGIEPRPGAGCFPPTAAPSEGRKEKA